MVSRMLKEVVLLACTPFGSHPISRPLARQFLGMEISWRRSNRHRDGKADGGQLQ